MPGRHSLFWKLVVLVAGFCLSMIWAARHISQYIDHQASYLSNEARSVLADYGAQARQAMNQGPDALQRWLQDMRQREPGWMAVVDSHLHPRGNQTLSNEELRLLTFVRHYEWPMSRRGEGLPLVSIPFGDAGEKLIMRLPERFRPWRHHALLTALTVYLPPIVLSVLFCWLLYALLIAPLERLRRQANAVRANDLDTLVPSSIAKRRDELGELGRSLEYLTQRLRDAVTQQQQLLRDLSHELRTPLSRLRVACESDLRDIELRDRVEREIGSMQQLVNNTLELAWLDSEQPRFACQPVDIEALWEVLCEDACFESGWPRERIRSALPEGCQVLGNLNALAQAMENILRNAIRHSPAQGTICLSARREGAWWLLSIEDQGPGVAENELQLIFRPFARLSAARPGGDGFGLGLAIAQGMVHMQGGRIWAENGITGLRVVIRLRDV
ncbi:HAMP domain-containing sensor histidine kinase [Pseudomonas lopnurensis]|uniref:HAMP domain-containing sensor histidine kinase n=1 Tax=Pseudomonas lopnurensis TaxID=1477517 RepID=UPI0028A66A48|nr:histidine kinase sensor domain-containing protein [Pseudomonas lopnurensis]